MKFLVFTIFLIIISNSLIYGKDIDLSDYKATELNAVTLNSFISTSKPTIIYYYTKSKESQKFLSIFLKVSEEYLDENDEIGFGVLDIDKELKIRNTLNIETPSIVYYKKGKEISELQGTKNKKSFEKFIENPLAAPPPSVGPGSWSGIESQVAHLSKRNFTSFLTNNNNVLAMFFTPQCGHCTKAKPAYGEASMSIIKQDLGKLAAVDCSTAKSICDTLKIESYPTFIYFQDGKKSDTYKGGRSKDDFINYLSGKSVNNNNDNNNNNNNKKVKKEL